MAIDWLTGCDICGDVDVDSRCSDCGGVIYVLISACIENGGFEVDDVIERMRSATRMAQIAYLSACKARRDYQYDWAAMAESAREAAHAVAFEYIGG